MLSYADSWTLDWVWILYLGFTFLLFSSIGSWGYTYRAHRRFDGLQPKGARDILDERYARGGISREQYGQLKADIASA